MYPGITQNIFFRELTDLYPCSLDDAYDSIGSKKITALEASIISGVPFSYLLKFSEFYSQKFYVNQHVLIPRPETEYLVEKLLEIRRTRGDPFGSVLDIATGSGVILLSLLAQDFAKMGIGSDISRQALNVAGINARRLRLQVQLFESDRFSKISGKFDVIVSNPPYIKTGSHRSGVHQSVDKHEPHIALFIPDADYDQWFRVFFQGVSEHLLPGGFFAMEGHEKELEQQAHRLRELGFESVSVENDLAGIPRYLMAKKEASS